MTLAHAAAVKSLRNVVVHNNKGEPEVRLYVFKL